MVSDALGDKDRVRSAADFAVGVVGELDHHRRLVALGGGLDKCAGLPPVVRVIGAQGHALIIGPQIALPVKGTVVVEDLS